MIRYAISITEIEKLIREFFAPHNEKISRILTEKLTKLINNPDLRGRTA